MVKCSKCGREVDEGDILYETTLAIKLLISKDDLGKMWSARAVALGYLDNPEIEPENFELSGSDEPVGCIACAR